MRSSNRAISAEPKNRAAKFYVRLLENLICHLVLIFKWGLYRRAGLLAK